MSESTTAPIGELCAEVKNYFLGSDPRKNIHVGTFVIENGQMSPLDFLRDGQYFRIVGSTFNDGVYQYPAIWLTDETFDGAVWAMNVPPAFVALAEKIEEYNNSDAAKPSAFTSESFGGYSYTRATGSDGLPVPWQKAFARDLNQYRRYSVL